MPWRRAAPPRPTPSASAAWRRERSRRGLDPLAGAGGTPGALRMFDVNLRAPFVDPVVIEDSLVLANALKLNDQELPALAAMFGLPAERGRRWPAWPTGSTSRWWR